MLVQSGARQLRCLGSKKETKKRAWSSWQNGCPAHGRLVTAGESLTSLQNSSSSKGAMFISCFSNPTLTIFTRGVLNLTCSSWFIYSFSDLLHGLNFLEVHSWKHQQAFLLSFFFLSRCRIAEFILKWLYNLSDCWTVWGHPWCLSSLALDLNAPELHSSNTFKLCHRI